MISCEDSQKIKLSFEYSVDSKQHTIEYITKKTHSKCNDIIFELFKKFEEITNLKLVQFQNNPKGSGYETLPISELSFPISQKIRNNLELSGDSKIFIFRFNKGKCRLLLVQSRKCPSLFYVIGYDWDFSAYNHGK